MQKRFMLFLVIAIALSGAVSEKKQVQAENEKKLTAQIKKKTSQPVLRIDYADYDCDGEKEAFILTKKNKIEQTLWFSSIEEVKKIAVSHFYLDKERICTVSRKQKLFVIEGTSGGSYSWSYCFYVNQGKCHSAQNAGENLSHLSGKDFVIYPSAYDAQKDDLCKGLLLGHTWKAYYMKWTGNKFSIYKGVPISIGQLQSYSGAAEYVKKIRSAGYKIGKIFLRKNGIININLFRKKKFITYYENVTLKRNGRWVSLVVHDKTGKNIVEKSSYGGIYRATI